MRLAAAVLLSALSFSAAAAPVAYTLDPAHTQALFSWSHLGYSHPEAGFDDIRGTLQWDAAHIENSSVDVTIQIDSVHSHVPALDEKLKTAEFFDTAQFPSATFVSTKVTRAGKGDRLRIDGNLTLHGVTKPVTLDAKLNQVGSYPMLEVPAAGFDATATIQRSAFGIAAGIPMIGDAITLRISTEALEAKGYAAAMAKFAAPAK